MLASFHIKNITDKTIEKATFSFTNSLNFQVAPHASRQPSDPIPVTPLIPATIVHFKLPFQYESFTQPQSLPGVFDYTSGKIDFTLVFPCSAFILPANIDGNTFVEIMRNEAQEVQTTHITTTLQKATAKICGIFHLKIVERDEKKMSMYGKTMQNHHVAFLLMSEGEDNVGVAIRSNNKMLAVSLLQELECLNW